MTSADIERTIKRLDNNLARINQALEKMNEIYIDLRSEMPESLDWNAFVKSRTSFENKGEAIKEERKSLLRVARRLREQERRDAILIKPRPAGFQINGWDL
jgi:hypothetical protein